MSGSGTTPGDDALLAELGRALRDRAVPLPQVLAAAKGVFSWRTVDAELAALTHDSLVDGTAVTRSSGTDEPRALMFEAGVVRIEIEVDETRTAKLLVGQVVPVRTVRLWMCAGGEPVECAVDALGRFVAELPPGPGRVAFRCRLADGATVETAATAL